MPRIKIQCGKDRDNVVIALASAGYMVRVDEIKDLLHTDYYVEYEDEEELGQGEYNIPPDVTVCACAVNPPKVVPWESPESILTVPEVEE